MNVDLIRALELRAPEPAADLRSGKTGSGFPDLMDAMLGGAADARPAPPPKAEDDGPRRAESRDAKSERGVRAGRAERTERPTRTPRGEKREKLRDEAEETSGRPVESDEMAAGSSAAPERRREGARKSESKAGDEEASALGEAEPTVMAAATAAIAVPALIGLATGSAANAVVEADAAAVAATSASDAVGDDVVDSLADATRGLGAGVGGAADGEADALPAAVAPRAAFEAGTAEKVIAALQGAEDDGSTALEARAEIADPDGPRDPSSAPSRTSEVASALTETARAEGSRRELETPTARAVEAHLAPEATAAQARGGNAGMSDDRARDPEVILAPPVEAERGQSTTPATTASTPSPTAVVDAAGRPQDVAAQARVDGMALSQPARMPEPLSPMQTGRPMPASAPDSIAVQADWLANRGGGTARIVLHPPELGEIAIRVTVRNQSVDVVMVAQTALAHQVAEDQGDRLAQAFAGRDLRLEQFEVRRGDPSDGSSTGQFGSSDAGARERERAEEQAQARAERGGVAQGGTRRGAVGIDPAIAPARGVANGRAAGIDLRI